jgi:hypothetical protein
LFAAHPLGGIGAGNWFVEYGVHHGGDHFAHSDLVGLLVERGVAGAALWLALGVALLIHRQQPLVRCTVLGAFGLGLFDSVLQLPAPLLLVTLVAWVGSSAEAPVEVRRAPGVAAVAALLAVGTSLSFASHLLSTASSTPFDRLEWASALDPLDGELHVTLAEAWASAGDCPRARRHSDAVRWLIPHHPRLPEIDAVCPGPGDPVGQGSDSGGNLRWARAGEWPAWHTGGTTRSASDDSPREIAALVRNRGGVHGMGSLFRVPGG